MTTDDMKTGLQYINKILLEDNDDIKILNDIFIDIRLGDIGKVKCISSEELEYYKKEGFDKDHIDSLSNIDNFCIIPYPDDLEQEPSEDYLIFLRGQLDGTRGEYSNKVFDCKYFIDKVKDGIIVEFIKT